MDSNKSSLILFGAEKMLEPAFQCNCFFLALMSDPVATENAGTIVSSAAAPGGMAQGQQRAHEKCISNINFNHFSTSCSKETIVHTQMKLASRQLPINCRQPCHHCHKGAV